MPSQSREMSGVFFRERHRFENPDGDVIVGVLSDKTQIKGPVTPTEPLRAGVRYRFYGRETDTQYGLQFHFNSYSVETPYGESETIAYLTLLDGIGPSTASALWRKFGENAIETLKNRPQECAGLGRQFNQDKAETASRALKMWERTEHVKVSLLALLGGKGFPKKTVQRAIEAGGTAAADIICRNPYWLIQFPGCAFGNTDALYVDLANKLPPEQRMKRLSRIKRQALCLYYGVKSDTNGHTWFEGESVLNSLFKNLAGARIQPSKALRLALRAKMLTCKRDCPVCFGKKKYADGTPCETCDGKGGKPYLTDAQRSIAEWSVADSIVRIMESKHELEWPDTSSFVAATDPASEFYRENQMGRLSLALSTRIGVLAGSPGTGKTFCASKLTKKLISTFGSYSIAICAPTGKAAQRLNEMLAASGIKSITATTIHRLLGVCASRDGGFQFVHDSNNPLPFKFIIADEASMIDTSLMSSLLSAIPKTSHLLLVGDPNQLSPVGHGCPLRDLIRSKFCGIGELTEIRRNSGRIVLACKEIREQQQFSAPSRLNIEAGENLMFCHCNTPDDQVEQIVAVIQNIASKGKHDPVWDCQVLVAVNENSQVSRKSLNARLQQLLNPNGETCEGNPFRVGDKIINSRNNWYTTVAGDLSNEDVNDSGQVFVANGEMGKVLKVFKSCTVLKVANRQVEIRIPHATREENEDGGGSDWSVAYAISGHKSQGSEWPIGIVVVDESTGGRMVCSREWIYTCISRFKTACVLVGKQATARSFCMRSSLNLRKTFLVERIREISQVGRKEEDNERDPD